MEEYRTFNHTHKHAIKCVLPTFSDLVFKETNIQATIKTKAQFYDLKKCNVMKDHLIRRSRRYANSQCAIFSTAERETERKLDYNKIIQCYSFTQHKGAVWTPVLITLQGALWQHLHQFS